MGKYTGSLKKWYSSLFKKNGEKDISESIDEFSINEVNVEELSVNEEPQPNIVQVEHTYQNNVQTSISTETPILLYDGKYDDLFLTPTATIPKSIVREELWDVIKERLPEDYTIPCQSSKYLYNIYF